MCHGIDVHSCHPSLFNTQKRCLPVINFHDCLVLNLVVHACTVKIFPFLTLDSGQTRLEWVCRSNIHLGDFQSVVNYLGDPLTRLR